MFKRIVCILVVGLLLGGLGRFATASWSPGAVVAAAPAHTITVTAGPTPISSPLPEGNFPEFQWQFKVHPPVSPPVAIQSMRGEPSGTTLPSDGYTGGLNGSVGAIQVKASSLQASATHYVVTFEINGVDHSVDTSNPRARHSAHVDFGMAGVMTPDYATFTVRVLDSNEQLMTTYRDTVWVTAFTLDGSRIRLNDTAGNVAAIGIVDGIGSISLTVMGRVEGDMVLLQIDGPRLDTARSCIYL